MMSDLPASSCRLVARSLALPGWCNMLVVQYLFAGVTCTSRIMYGVDIHAALLVATHNAQFIMVNVRCME